MICVYIFLHAKLTVTMDINGHTNHESIQIWRISE